MKRPDLIRSSAFVAGKWLQSSSNAYSVINPATNAQIASVSDSQANIEGLQAINAASKAFHSFSLETTAKERSIMLKRWHKLIHEHLDDLALILTMECGKPLSESRGEILYGASYVEWFSEEVKRSYGDIIPSPSLNRRMMVMKQPVGVTAMIKPWNFPNAMITRKLAPAIAAGCTTIIKPASETPLSALALALLAQEAGIPDGVINVLPSSRRNTPVLGELLCTHPDIRKISFTGSTGTGKMLMRMASGTVKRMSMELGGNAVFIVFPDLGEQTEEEYLDNVVRGFMAAKFRNAGQTCICPNRVFVHRKLYEKFIQRLRKAMISQVNIGNGLDVTVTQGPLISNDACVKVERISKDAIDKGAKLELGGKRATINGLSNLFFEPTILGNCTNDMLVAKEEIFGPVAAIFPFETESEVIQLANQTRVGLASYFYSNDMKRIWRVAERLEVGMVGVNEGAISSELIPFGGVKESGFGREGSYQGLDEYLQTKYVCLGGL